MYNKILGFIVLTTLVTGCGKQILFEESVLFGQNGWSMNYPAVFTFNHADTSKIVDVGVTISHANDYPYSNIWLFTQVVGPEGMVQQDTLEFFIALPDGKWLGKRRRNEIEVSAMYQQGVKLSKPGIYSFSLVHGMRHESIVGINELSFWIQESEIKSLDYSPEGIDE